MFRVTVSVAFILFLAAIAAAQTTVIGKVTDQDGKPMIKANVLLVSPTDVETVIRNVPAEKNGNYKMTIDSTGVWLLEFTGVYHRFHRVALYLDKPATIHLDVRLKTYDYLPDTSTVKVLGSFNGWSQTTAVPMKKQVGGTYALEIKSDADSVAYRLLNVVQGDLIEGTQADYYSYDGYWGYNAVVRPTKGVVKIVYDPAKLPRSDKPYRVEFANPASMEARFSRTFDKMQGYESEFMKAYMAYSKSGESPLGFRYDWAPTLDTIKSQLAGEKNPVLRQELLLSYLELGALTAKVDSSMAREAINEIPPSSRMWAIMPMVSRALELAGLDKQEHEAYVQKLIDENPDVGVKTTVLATELMLAKETGDAAASAKYYSILVNRYGDTRVGKEVKARFSPGPGPEVGKPVPAFSVTSMEDSTRKITNVSLKGKYYLMDFWATWCHPCVEEMPNLQKAYEKFKNKDFTILSLSLDQSKEAVVKFREGKWKMPWLQSFLGRNSQNRILKDFDVMAIPNPVLVDSTGKVLAVGVVLRGSELIKTLEEYLGK